MKREYKIAICLGSIGALYCLLFPCWEWSQPHGDVIESGLNERAFILSPPSASAQIDFASSLISSGLVVTLVAGALLLYQFRQRDKEAALFWQIKWDYTDKSSNSLLRASEEPVQEPQTVLLRAVTEVQETPPEQLVRTVEGAE